MNNRDIYDMLVSLNAAIEYEEGALATAGLVAGLAAGCEAGRPVSRSAVGARGGEAALVGGRRVAGAEQARRGEAAPAVSRGEHGVGAVGGRCATPTANPASSR